MIVRDVRDHTKQARRVCGSGIGAAQQSRDAAGHQQVGGSGLGRHVNKLVSTPVGDSEPGAVILQGFTDGGVGLMGPMGTYGSAVCDL